MCPCICEFVFMYLYLPSVVAPCFQHEEWVYASTVTSNLVLLLCVSVCLYAVFCLLYFVFVFHISSGLRNDYGTTEVSLRRHYGARSLVRRLPCLESRWLEHGIRGAFSNQLFRQTDNIINRAMHLQCISEILMFINKAPWCFTGVPILSTFSLSRFSLDKGESDPYHYAFSYPRPSWKIFTK